MKNDADLFLRVRGDKKKTEKDDADMFLRINLDKMNGRMTQTCG